MGALRKPDITFQRSGRVNITSKISHILSLKDGDIVDLFFDDVNKELYFYVRIDSSKIDGINARFGNTVKYNKKNSNFFRVQSVELTSFVRKLTNSEEAWMMCGKPQIVPINGKQTIAVPIIWRNNLYYQYKNNTPC